MAADAKKGLPLALGDMVPERAYYHCEKCEVGFCPCDYALGLAATSLSPAVARMNGQAAAMLSFAETHELLRDLAGVEVSTKQVERSAEALGGEIAGDERTVVEPPTVAAAVMPTMYLGMDSTGVPMRSVELVKRKGKQPDGSSKTREVKLVTVWSAEDRDEQGFAYGTPARSATVRPLKAPPIATSIKRLPNSPNALSAKRADGASMWLTAKSCWVTGLRGSGT